MTPTNHPEFDVQQPATMTAGVPGSTEPLEIEMNTLPAAVLLLVVGVGGAYVISSVPVVAFGVFAFAGCGAALVAWAGKRGVLLRVTSDELVYGGVFPKALARHDVAQIQPMPDHIAVILHDGRTIAIGRGFSNLAEVGARLESWPQTGVVGPSLLEQMARMNHQG